MLRVKIVLTWSCCLVFLGIYQDPEQGVVDGACPPLLIHSDRSKTKSKEAEERNRQRKGETPRKDEVAVRFMEGMDASMGIKVATTHSGSMTQEVFYKFAQHFVNTLPENHGPVLLIVDGHASRWSLQALQLLLTNKVYLFVIASHTSIWAQPNDCGLNLRFHRCIETICKRRRRRQAGTPGVEYFNGIFCDAWRLYLQQEREELLSNNKRNNTTSAYEKTGLYPFDPNCWAWTEAIESLGQTSTLQRDEKRKVQYEVYPKQDIIELTPEEKTTLRDGLDINPNLEFTDKIVARMRLETIVLAKWRQAVDERAIEGNKWMDVANMLLPVHFADTDGDKIAMKLVEFRRVGQFKLQPAPAKTKEEKRHEETQDILRASPVTCAIKIEYIPESSSESDSDDNNVIQGSAVKRKGGKWTILLENDEQFTVEQGELLDGKKYTVMGANHNLSLDAKRKQKAKEIRQRARDERKVKQDLETKARMLMRERDLQLYEIVKRKVQEGNFDPADFFEIADDLRRPFRCEIEGRQIEIAGSDCALMVKNEVMELITNKVLVADKKRTQGDDANNDNRANKRRRTGGTAAVNTSLGADVYAALHQTSRRDRNANRKEIETKKNKLKKEEQETLKILEAIHKRKEKFPDNTHVGDAGGSDAIAVVVGATGTAAAETHATSDAAVNDENNPAVANVPGRAIPVQRNSENYWEIHENSNAEQRRLVLNMFAPGSGLLSKGKEAQWRFIQDNVLARLTKLSFDATHERLLNRLPAIERELEELEEDDNVEDDDEDVEEDNNEIQT